MASIWKRLPTKKGAQLAQPAAPPPSMPSLAMHSLIGGNGQHLLVAPRTGGHPWVGHMGKTPQASAFSPAESFSFHSGGPNIPSPTQLRATTPAAINSIVGQAAGTFQLAPGGGVRQPTIQSSPGSVGR